MSDTRFNPITGDPVILSPDRGARPGAWSDAREPEPSSCPFCPGNEHETPPEIEGTGDDSWAHRVVPNKYPALDHTADGPRHEVLIDARQHDLAFEDMSLDHLAGAIDVWKRRATAQSALPNRRYVAVFRNEGQGAGQSIPHPHSQILALDFVPSRIQRELEGFKLGDCPLCEMIETEVASQEIVVDEAGSLELLTPRAGRVPFEMWIVNRDHESDWTGTESSHLATLLRSGVRRLRTVHPEAPFNLGFMTSPLQTPDAERFHWYAELTPRLTSMAGFEMATSGWINIQTPERAAELLRNAIP